MTPRQVFAFALVALASAASSSAGARGRRPRRRRPIAWWSPARATPSTWTRRAPTTSNRWRWPSRSTAGWSASRPAASSPSPISPPAGRSAPTARSGPSSCAPTSSSTTARRSTPTRWSSPSSASCVADHPAHEADFVWTRAFHNIRRVARATAAARAVRDRSPVRAVPGQPGDGPGGDRVADGGPAAGQQVREPPGGHRPVPLRRVDPGRSHHARAQPAVLGPAAAHPLPGLADAARLAPAPAGAGVGRRRRDPAAGARRSVAGAACTPTCRLADGAGGAGVVPGDEHAAPPAERPAHPARDRPRHPARRAGQADLPGAGHPGDRAAAAQRVGRALRRGHVPLRPGARARALLAEAGWRGDARSRR